MHETVLNFVRKAHDLEEYNRERNHFNTFQIRRCKVGSSAMNVPLSCADELHPLYSHKTQFEIWISYGCKYENKCFLSYAEVKLGIELQTFLTSFKTLQMEVAGS